MTTPTAAPGIHQYPEPCWTVVLAGKPDAFADEAEHHYLTEQDAKDAIADYGVPTHRAVQVNAPGCWYAITACGQPFVYHGDDEEQHFADRDAILTSAMLQDNVLVDGDVLTCDEDCETCTPARAAIKQALSIEQTDPSVFTYAGADPVTDPTRIDWAERRRLAKMPFMLVDGRPVNPWGSNLKYGRGELGHWAERANADAFVFVTVAGQRYLLMGERDDDHGWAIPGGGLDDGEGRIAGALRELGEETGLHVDVTTLTVPLQVGSFRHVADPRESREAWMVTAPVIIDLGPVDELPVLTCTSDLKRAEWIPAGTPEQARAAIAGLGGTVFPAHEQMLTTAIVGWAK